MGTDKSWAGFGWAESPLATQNLDRSRPGAGQRDPIQLDYSSVVSLGSVFPRLVFDKKQNILQRLLEFRESVRAPGLDAPLLHKHLCVCAHRHQPSPGPRPLLPPFFFPSHGSPPPRCRTHHRFCGSVHTPPRSTALHTPRTASPPRLAVHKNPGWRETDAASPGGAVANSMPPSWLAA